MADTKSIRYGNQTMPMPDGMTLDQAKAIMARHFPELAENPKIETKKDGDHTTYVFSKQAGRKGAPSKTRAAHPNHKVIKHLNKLKPAPIVPSSTLKYVRADATYLNHADEDALNAEITRVTEARAALRALAPSLPPTSEALLL